MRIGIATKKFPALSETFVLRHATSLIERGFAVDVLSLEHGKDDKVHPDVAAYELLDRTCFRQPEIYSGRRERWTNAMGWLSHLMWRNPNGGRRVLAALPRLLRAGSWTSFYTAVLAHWSLADVLHCHFGSVGREFAVLKRFGLLPAPLVVTFHGTDANVFPSIHGEDCYDELFQVADRITVGTEFMRKRLLDLGAPSDRVIKHPMGIDLNRFSSTAGVRRDDSEIRLLSVGRLVEVKGIEFAIRAMSRVIAEFPQVVYEIVGDGELASDLRLLVKQLGLENHVHFLGVKSHDTLPAIYAAADLFVFPGVVARNGSEEGQGLALLEAQAAGLPVLASRVGGVPESVDQHSSALLVSPADPDALATAIIALLQTPRRLLAMGAAGREFVSRHFDLEQLTDDLLDLYRQCAPRSDLGTTGDS